MKKLLIVTLLLLLVGCSNKTDSFLKYRECLDYFNNTNNYTIEEIDDGKKTVYIYTDDACYMKDDENELYLIKQDGELYISAYNEEYKTFVKEKIEYDEHYLYPYSQIERLEKISGFINNGSLVYKNNKFIGNKLKGKYLYNEKIHEPTKIEIELKDGKISQYNEEYKENGIIKTNTLSIYDYGTSRVVLPLNTIDMEEIDKFMEE